MKKITNSNEIIQQLNKQLIRNNLEKLDRLSIIQKQKIKINFLQTKVDSIVKISFYIPTINPDKKIEKCISTILKQTILPSEIIIVDGSKTLEQINKIVQDLKTSIPFKIIHQQQKGLANARNIAIANCKYNLIASCDDDVLLNENWLQKCLIHFNDEKIIGVGGNMKEHIRNDFDKWRSMHMKQHWGLKIIKNPKFLFGSNTIFKKEIITKMQYNEKYLTNYEDVDISKRIMKNGYTLIYEPNAKCTHIKSDDNQSLMKSYYNWTTSSYISPNSLLKKIIRIIFHISKMLKLVIKDILKPKFILFNIKLLEYSIQADFERLNNNNNNLE